MVYQYVAAAVAAVALGIYGLLKGDSEDESNGSDNKSRAEDAYPSLTEESHQREETAEAGTDESEIDRIDVSSTEAEEEISGDSTTTNKSRFSADVNESRISHEEAQEQDLPVKKGESYEVVPEDETFHHSGRRDLVANYSGLYIFIKDPPADVDIGDVVNVTITSFSRNKRAANAIILDEE